jgi:hypothetical protein
VWPHPAIEDARAWRLQKERDRKFSAASEEMARDSTRNILRMHGLPETALDGLPPNEVSVHLRAIAQYLNELKNEPDEVREHALSELPNTIKKARQERERPQKNGKDKRKAK